MTDSELRGIVLRRYYEERRKGFATLSKADFNNAIEMAIVHDISRQLDEHGLIEYTPAWGSTDGKVVVSGRITASGIDVIEGNAATPIAIQIGSIHTGDASAVQIGSGNARVTNNPVSQTFHGNVGNVAGGDLTQVNITVVQYLNGLAKVVEQSTDIPDDEKAGLVDRIKSLASNPYVVSLASAGIVETIKMAL